MDKQPFWILQFQLEIYFNIFSDVSQIFGKRSKTGESSLKTFWNARATFEIARETLRPARATFENEEAFWAKNGEICDITWKTSKQEGTSMISKCTHLQRIPKTFENARATFEIARATFENAGATFENAGATLKDE